MQRIVQITLRDTVCSLHHESRHPRVATFKRIANRNSVRYETGRGVLTDSAIVYGYDEQPTRRDDNNIIALAPKMAIVFAGLGLVPGRVRYT